MFDHPSQFLDALENLPVASAEFRDLALKRQAQLTKPAGALGRLEDIAIWLAGWQAREKPVVDRVTALLFAGNHGVVEEGVSPFPASVTAQMVENFKQGGAAINALTQQFGHELSVIPLDLERPTRNMTVDAAMSEDELLDVINIGAAAVNDCSADVIYFGEMGIGNTTTAAAIAAAVFGGEGASWAGPGTGLEKAGVVHKASVIDRALALHRSELSNPVEIMRRLGGRELAAIMGGVVAARLKRLPVILDGFVVTAAVAPLCVSADQRIKRDVLAHCIAGHCSAEPGHIRLLEELGLKPLLTLDMRLGEGTGAALAAELVRGAVSTHNQMATFAEAQISGGEV